MKIKEKSKKTKLPVWAIVVIIVFGIMTIAPILFVVAAIAIDGVGTANVEKDLRVNSIISAECNKENDAYIITGTVENTSDENYTGVSISYDLYDNDGNVVGVASANIERIGKGATWKFNAEYYTSNCKEVAKYKFYKIDGFTDSFLLD